MYIEESIEEQANAIQKAIAEIEAKASKYQQNYVAVASEKDMLDKTDPVAQKEIATAEAQIEIVEKVGAAQTKDAALATEQDLLDKADTAVQMQTTTAEAKTKPVEKEEARPTTPARHQATLDMNDLIAQEQQATAEAQIEIVEKVEVVQTNDAALATEQGMLEKLDRPEAADADVMTEMKQPAQKQASKPPSVSKKEKPVGERWAVAAPGVDLSGDWSLIISDDFKKDYDEYLKQLGQPFLVRSVALTLIGVTKEYTEQKEEGRTLFIRGTNARGIWERTLVTSGADRVNDQFTPLHVPIDTADDERVDAESWWEEDGTVHRSWMRGLKKYGGGDFESKRYLDEGGKILVCESIFHPNEKDRKDVTVTWRFLRNGEMLDT